MAKGELLMSLTDTIVENANKFEILFQENTWDLGISGNFLLQRMS
jgi:hypothetical protein